MQAISIHWPSILIAIGSILVMSGGFWAAIEQNKSDKKLLSLTKENKELSTRLHDSVTGGNSYPFFIYSRSITKIHNKNKIAVILSVKGENPIFDLIVEQVDLTDPLEPKRFKSGQELLAAVMAERKGLKGGNFVPNRAFTIGTFTIKTTKNETKFRIDSIGRNGAFSQTTKLLRTKDGDWIMAYYKIEKEVSNTEKKLIEEKDLLAKQ